MASPLITRAKLLSWLLIILVPAFAPAQFLTSTQNNTITITGYTGTNPVVNIPATMGVFPVTTIGPQAFYQNDTITEVTLSANVSIIDSNAFSYCPNLATFTFQGPGLMTIGDYAFASDYNLGAFTLPSSVTSMGQGVFYEDYGLTSFNIQNGATTLGPDALYYCFSLPSLSIPQSMVNIGSDAFLGCYGLGSIMVDPANASFVSSNGVLFNKGMTTLIQYPPASPAAGYVVPDTVTALGDGAFQGTYSLLETTLPKGLTTIGQYAYFGAGIENIDIPETVTDIQDHALSGSALTNLCLPCGVTCISDYLCYSCQSLCKVRYPGELKMIGADSFAFCPALESAVIPGNVTSIGEFAFYETALKFTKIGPGVSTVGEFAFYGCTDLVTAVISGGTTSLGNDAFSDCPALGSVYFGGTIPTGTSSAFDNDNATFYYLPGYSGWSTLSGFQTELWNPQIKRNANFGLRGGEFGFDISGNDNLTVGVEATTSLRYPRWDPVSTVTLTGGSAHFSDPDWSLHSSRFYRVNFPF